MHGFEENFGLFDVFVDLASFHGRFWPFFPLCGGLGTLDYKLLLILYRIAVAVRQLLTAPDSQTDRWLRNLKLLG